MAPDDDDDMNTKSTHKSLWQRVSLNKFPHQKSRVLGTKTKTAAVHGSSDCKKKIQFVKVNPLVKFRGKLVSFKTLLLKIIYLMKYGTKIQFKTI